MRRRGLSRPGLLTRPPARWRVLMVLVGLLAVGCSTDDGPDPADTAASSIASGSPSPVAAPPPPRAPDRLACYALSYAEAVAPTVAQQAVACDQRHTSQTFLVGRLRQAFGGHLVAVDSDAVQREVADTCPRRLTGYLGGTPEQLRLSLLRSVWFTPTVADSDAGASWYRCDVVAAIGDQRLAPLGADLQGALDSPATRAAYAMCATDRPGAADFQRVLCRDPHTWRAVRSVDLAGLAGANGDYPGLTAVRQGGEQDGKNICADAARALAPDALDYQWGYEWPTADQWQTGQDYGRCWAPDSGAGNN